MDIKEWLQKASQKLIKAGSSSPRLDAELLLSAHLQKPREYFLSHPETLLLKGTSSKVLERMLLRRVKWEPMAYILGHKEFYGHNFAVTPDVLIPRPESEMMIDLLKQIVEFRISNFEFKERELQIVDIGTGSGCLAISAKLEWPNAKIIATDTSKKALDVAQKNAQRHCVEVEFLHDSLLEPIQNSKFEVRNSILVANLPYVDRSWKVSPETAYEPQEALYADNQGLELIKKLIIQASTKLSANGMLLLEADPRQHTSIVAYAEKNGFMLQQIQDFVIVLKKVK